MSNLISGKEAKLAWANDQEVDFYSEDLDTWFSLNDGVFLSDVFDVRKLRLKTKTILINGVEVPAPFKPNQDCVVWIIDDGKTCNYRTYQYEVDGDKNNDFIGMWRTEDEIKQVVEALRKVFNHG